MPKSTSYQKGHLHFSYHVAALIQDGDNHSLRVLLHRPAEDDFWSLPGGKVELGEESEQALRRQIRAQLDCEIEITRLLWLVENFFERGGEKFHELGLYFLARLPQGGPPLPRAFQWFPCRPEILADLNIRPTFLNDRLAQIPEQIENVKISCGNL